MTTTDEPTGYYIEITAEDVATAVDHGTTVSITGTDEDGKRVTFAGDHRMMEGLMAAALFYDEESVSALVEGWQIIRVTEAGA
jgi:hypothetical protein